MKKYKLLKGYYGSPRITGEILDCSMPMTFDSYSVCGFSCAYCFSFFQRSLGVGAENYFAKKFKVASINKFKKMFTDPDNYGGEFKEIIKNRITLQFGGLSDPFCPIEEEHGYGYEFLKFLREIDYPICFSSKGDLLIKPEGKKYLDLFSGAKNWSYKASIITLDDEKSRLVEAGCPSPERRLQVLKTLSDMGIWTILRLRPFIIGVSGKYDISSNKFTDDNFIRLINRAKDIGFKAISTEFFCLELRNVNKGKLNFKTISKACGFDIVQYYKNISNGSGYLRLNYEIKRPYMEKMEEICKEIGINFHVSDAHHKERGCSGSCCGLPQDESVSSFSKCQFTNALQIAKACGMVYWSDISKFGSYLKNHHYSINGLTSGAKDAEKRRNQTMYDTMRNIWNNPKSAKSPYKYFDGVLYPIGLDDNQDIIYEYRPR